MNAKAPDLEARLMRLALYYDWGSIRALALKCGLSHATLNSAIKRGTRLSQASADKIVEKTHCDFAWLMRGEGDWGLGPHPHGKGVEIARRTAHRDVDPAVSQSRLKKASRPSS